MNKIKRLFGDRIIIKQERKTNYGKIIIASNNAEKTKYAVVEMVGDEVENIKPGEKIMFEPFSETVLKEEENKVYSLIKEEDIIGLVE